MYFVFAKTNTLQVLESYVKTAVSRDYTVLLIEQKLIIENELKKWISGDEQIVDILILDVRF